jgi:hypothetical protein
MDLTVLKAGHLFVAECREDGMASVLEVVRIQEICKMPALQLLAFITDNILQARFTYRK